MTIPSDRELAPAIKHFAWLYGLVSLGGMLIALVIASQFSLTRSSVLLDTLGFVGDLKIPFLALIAGLAGRKAYERLGESYTRAMRVRLGWWLAAVAIGIGFLVGLIGSSLLPLFFSDDFRMYSEYRASSYGWLVPQEMRSYLSIAGGFIILIGAIAKFLLIRLGLYWMVPADDIGLGGGLRAWARVRMSVLAVGFMFSTKIVVGVGVLLYAYLNYLQHGYLNLGFPRISDKAAVSGTLSGLSELIFLAIPASCAVTWLALRWLVPAEVRKALKAAEASAAGD